MNFACQVIHHRDMEARSKIEVRPFANTTFD